MVDGQRSHVEWAAVQRDAVSRGKTETKNVGNAEHHDEWTKIYNWTIYYLTQDN